MSLSLLAILHEHMNHFSLRNIYSRDVHVMYVFHIVVVFTMCDSFIISISRC